VKWCRSCILPDTRPNLVLDSDGICNACRNHRSKARIDWAARAAALRDAVAAAKARASGYDCVIPVSGGKDSTWQTVKCLELGLKPLAVTWRPPGRTAIGRRNLDNLISLGVDHIDYTVDPKVERKLMLKGFSRFGSTAIAMHLALFAIPLNMAVRLRIPLVIWGENSAFEYGNADDAHTGLALDDEWLETYGVTHGTRAADWVDHELSAKDLTPYTWPSDEELARAGVRAVFLGYYLPWDPQETYRVASAHGFREADAARTGYYAYADIDDDFISLHHWMKWYKFGFTRLFDNLSLEIRNGRISRERAVAIVREAGDQTPHRDIASFCAFAGIPESDFHAIAERFRNPAVWQRRADGAWYIPDFLIEDWRWT
jgi:N-acetyl sugar amidotransferase